MAAARKPKAPLQTYVSACQLQEGHPSESGNTCSRLLGDPTALMHTDAGLFGHRDAVPFAVVPGQWVVQQLDGMPGVVVEHDEFVAGWTPAPPVLSEPAPEAP